MVYQRPPVLEPTVTNRAYLFAVYREALHRGLLAVPDKELIGSTRIARATCGIPRVKLWRCALMLVSAGLLQIVSGGLGITAVPVATSRWAEILDSENDFPGRANDWWEYVEGRIHAR